MTQFSDRTLTDAVLKSLEATEDPRLKQVVSGLVRHLHGFIREVAPTEAEWNAGMRFLAEAGWMCDDRRQEFNLLSDILGATMMVDYVNHRAPDGASESSVLGPFYRAGAEVMAAGSNISRDGLGEPVIVSGRVSDLARAPIEGAVLDVWQTSPVGLYENQDPEQPEMNLRGRFLTDQGGRYRFRTVRPSSYPIPHDGPAGRLLRALGRHPYRPAHIHFIISAEGYAPLTTQLFVSGDEYLDSDAVFGVKDALIVDLRRHEAEDEAHRLEVSAPFYTVEYDFALRPAA
jgi:hydroxyquinol 1,2-dioxygenase